jgi:hypothetical protein
VTLQVQDYVSSNTLDLRSIYFSPRVKYVKYENFEDQGRHVYIISS